VKRVRPHGSQSDAPATLLLHAAVADNDNGNGIGVTSTPMVGIDRSSQRGIHQLTGPRISMIDGSSIMRTIVASTRTAVAKPRPRP
jgi:hypothetical protein